MSLTPTPHWRGWLNRLRRRLAHLLLHRVVFGEVSGGRYRPYARIAPSTCIEHEERLQLADHVFIGAFNFIEASGGVTLGEGVQITHHVSIVTHSSHRAMRLLGRAYVDWPAGQPRPGWVAAPVHIGPWCFIGPHTLLEPGTRLGRGCIVRAGSVLRGDYPEHAVIAGNPAVVVGDARDGDAKALTADPSLLRHYEAWAGARAKPPGQEAPR
jgi:acetyltransferase-like isoleucine patch superfamily enzyme